VLGEKTEADKNPGKVKEAKEKKPGQEASKSVAKGRVYLFLVRPTPKDRGLI
jgi:hypothetical protein